MIHGDEFTNKGIENFSKFLSTYPYLEELAICITNSNLSSQGIISLAGAIN